MRPETTNSDPARAGRPASSTFDGGGGLPASLTAEAEAGGWDAVWRLAPGIATPAAEPGRAHADETLATMLGDAFLDAWALAERPLDALVVGCGEGWLCHRLLDLGARRVLGVDTRATPLRRARLLREHAAREGDLELMEVNDLERVDPAAIGTFDVVVAGAPVEQLADRDRALAAARRCTRKLCAIDTSDRVVATLAARAAGFEAVALAPVPLDAERRYVLAERALLLARPEAVR